MPFFTSSRRVEIDLKLSNKIPKLIGRLKAKRLKKEKVDNVLVCDSRPSAFIFEPGCNLQRVTDYDLLGQLFEELGCHPLVEIDLFFVNIPVKIVTMLLRQTAHTLQKLSLRGFTFWGRTKAFFASLTNHPTLKKFHLERRCQFKPYKDLKLFLHALATCSSLEHVFWDDTNNPGWAGVYLPLGPAVEAICHSSSLQRLSLPDTEFLNSDHSSQVRVVRGLKRNTTLKAIDFGCCLGCFEQAEVDAVAEMLLVNSVLQELVFTTQYTGRINLLPIVEALMVNKSLKLLDPKRCPFRMDDETQSLAFHELLENNNNTLEVLRLSFKAPQEEFIRYYLKLNAAGRGHLLNNEEHSTRKDWVDMIISNSQDESVIFFFLSNNPSLCQMALASMPERRSTRARKRRKIFVSYYH